MIEECPLLKNFLEKQGPYIFDNARKYRNEDVQRVAFQYVERSPYARRYALPADDRFYLCKMPYSINMCIYNDDILKILDIYLEN